MRWGVQAPFRGPSTSFDHGLRILTLAKRVGGAGANPWHMDEENMTALEVTARYNSTHR